MTTSYMFEERTNPKAKIAFMVWTPFHYYVYKNIIKYLPEAEFVVVDTWYQTIHDRGRAHLDEAVSFLKEREQHWRVLTELTNKTAIERFFEKYEIVVSTLLNPPLDSLSLDDWFARKKSVLVGYGVAKDLATFGPWVAQFDLSLVEGPRTHAYHQLLTEAHAVGVSKFDDWFTNSPDGTLLDRTNERLDHTKRTILYLPTHSGLSSLYAFGEAVQALKTDYNVLIKFHHHNKLIERPIVERLSQDQGLFLFDERDDILPLFALADVVISDSSSAMLEAVLVDKALVILDVASDEALIKKHVKGEEFNSFWYSGGATYDGSIEQQVKEPAQAVGVVIKDERELPRAVADALENHGCFQQNREQLRKKLFSHTDGTAGERSAVLIRGLLSREKPRPPLLGMAIRSYFTNLRKNYAFQIKKKNQLIERQRELVKELQKELLRSRQAARFSEGFIKERSFLKKAFLAVKLLFPS